MTVHNAEVATAFEEMADLLEIEGANPFRVRAYRFAARTLRDLPVEVGEMVAKGEDLTSLPGIGDDLAGKIKEILATGTAAAIEAQRKRVPATLTGLLRIPGLGPKRVKRLAHELKIRSLSELQTAAQAGRVRTLAGFGEKTEQHILDALATRLAEAPRVQRAVAIPSAEALVAYLEQSSGVSRVIAAGSYRRGLETIGDLDILVTAPAGRAVMDRFVAYQEVRDVLARGETKSSVRLQSGLQVDLRVVPQDSYGAALLYFTGSKAHNVVLRQLAQQRGLKLNEYGVFRGDKPIAGETEESVYASLGLPWIPPELREGRGEIDAAKAGRLPHLVDLQDLKGDLHAHTRATDGRNSLQEMAEAARLRGLRYFAITDHSRRLTMAKGLDSARLLQQTEAIDRLNATLSGITILKGIEVDILEDGNLDLPDEVLGRLDLVVGAVHSRFNLSNRRQTERIMKAMDHPHFSILAHPSGRLIGRREPYEVDMLRIIRKARERRCFLEINAHPERLDLTDIHCRMAKEEGVLLAVNTDAHSMLDLENARFGVGQARRGWLEKTDVLNTRPYAELRKLLKPTMEG
ncbi:MAG: DNA polymerase/3'-5' exonuclease PolX [Nitrospira sp.]|jgi:DNA polymerase (family 10)|uniref:DNA polymerase/3'-5' exonuclease PolX n=1 Tax=Nitrospira sp. ND1 TaxID=1658518 RepID=UPI0009BBB7F6|nr:DNA polymerase/3'-5' exonuclease PolX [Nitrospira sp. ND1]MBP6198941.1 DNA polymerase/3'-5' exonuclease PolX [Nitrospira sp.]SLM45100.1 putative DNA-directed DNA polymerase, family X, modulated with phosphoesterase domain [Nitrospira sp. ND1]HAN90661.1 DNA polymerase/3'-5' exonuclease PolX [Nitrospira sp.]